jgi:tetratricopeptide (TPR) repeat protein
MEGKKCFIRLMTIVGIFVLTFNASIGQPSYKDQIYKAYIRGNMTKWYAIMTACETDGKRNTTDAKLELINYYYGYTGWLISVKKYEEAKLYIGKSENIINNILVENPQNATALAYKGAFLAYEIGVTNLKAIFLGYKSMGYIDQALEIEPMNVQAHIEKGNAMFYSPSAFGGDKKQAIFHYRDAVKYMEQLDLIENNWMYLNTMTAMGLAYEATKQIQDAKLCYEKIIRFEPHFMWVGEELYPDMLKRYNL